MSDDIITAVIGLVGVLVGGALTVGAEWLARRSKTKQELAYLAILVVSQLDRFANGCLYVAYDDGTVDGQPAGKDSVYYEPTTTQPEFAPLDLQVEWRVLPAGLLYSILSIPDKTIQAIRRIYAETGDEDYDGSDYMFERQLGFAELGLEVSRIATRLREHAKLPMEPGAQSRDKELSRIAKDKADTKAAVAARRAAAFVPLSKLIEAGSNQAEQKDE